MSVNLDRFSRPMPWEKEEPMVDYCLDCGAEVPFGKSYCGYCEDRHYEVNKIKKDLILLEERAKRVISSLDCLLECMRKNAYEYKAQAGKEQDTYQKGIDVGLSVAYDILSMRVEDIKKELQKAVQ